MDFFLFVYLLGMVKQKPRKKQQRYPDKDGTVYNQAKEGAKRNKQFYMPADNAHMIIFSTRNP